MGPPRHGTSIRFRVMLDGQPPRSAHGVDVDEGGNGMAVEQRLDPAIRQTRPIVGPARVKDFFGFVPMLAEHALLTRIFDAEKCGAESSHALRAGSIG
jgi:hypothetical protein